VTQDYPIRTSAAEVARLHMQSDLLRADADAMLEQIGVEPGWRCLDLCCGVGGITDVLSRRVGPMGTVLGADVDAAKLAVARDWALASGLRNVAFEQADAFATGFAPGTFDLVHCRFALSIIPNGLGILDHMLTLVRPGGIVFVEESNAHTMECAPPHPAWDRLLAAMVEVLVKNGANPRLGPSLYAIFRAKGLTELRVQPCLYALHAGDPMTMHLPATMESMREAALALGMFTGAEFDELLARLREHLSRPDTLTLTYTTVQVVGRAPEPR
jgi:ubiquinone/menaquinone biosynthesis C-methylase UbiE